jgi:RNA polymerase sigma-70 factor (family 1)
MAQADHELNHLIHEIAVNNNEQAYKHLFEVLFTRLNRFAYSILKCNELAEEVASDVMITIWRNRGNLSHIQNITVYAFVAAKNKSLTVLKQNANNKTVSIEDIEFDINFHDLTPEQVLINGELKHKIECAIQALPPKCKNIFRLIKEDGLSYKDVAELLNISTKTVDAQMVTATKKICALVRAEYNLIS